MTPSERIGNRLGQMIAPLVNRVSHWREARTFHPRGDLARAHVDAIGAGALAPLGHALQGTALVRFSNALWKAARWPDALGCAISFGEPNADDEQHLLFATIRRPWTMPFSPFTTNVGHYLANDYFAVSPFEVPALTERRWLRITPEVKAAAPKASRWAERRDALSRSIDRGTATLLLQASSSPWGPWESAARIRLTELIAGDPPALAFDPFVDGRGVVPTGFIHAIRLGAYAGSRRGRAAPAPEAVLHQAEPLRRAG